MNVRRWAVVLGLGGMVAGACWLGSRGQRDAGADVRPPDPRQTELQRRADWAAEYLVRACQADGQFAYRIHLDPAATLEPRYNVLRHAGAIYALASYGREHPCEPVRAAVARAARYLRLRHMAPPPERPDLLAVWEPPGQPEGPEAKLGGAGLALCALVAQEQMDPGSTARDDLQRLAEFILFLQREDGSFFSKYLPAQGGPSGEWESMYYPAEAALGLIKLSQLDGSPRWRDAAVRTLVHLARSQEDQEELVPDHWILLASAELWATTPAEQYPAERAILVDHAARLSRQFVAQLDQWPEDTELAGCFTGDGRTCPTATKLEGLLAALTFLPPQQKALRQEIRRAADEGFEFLWRAQVKEGRYAGGFPRSVRSEPPAYCEYPADLLDDYTRRAGEIRIDYVQHALCAMLQDQAP